jgi:hypothetical protein
MNKGMLQATQYAISVLEEKKISQNTNQPTNRRYKMAKYEKKIYKVTIMGNDYFAYGLTKQGAIKTVFEAIKGSGFAEIATGKEIFDYGKDDGLIFGDSEEQHTITAQGELELDKKSQTDYDNDPSVPDAIVA